MSQGIHSGEARLDILLHELGHQVFRLFTDRGPGLTSETPHTLLDLGNNLIVTAIERRRTTQHDVKHDSDRPQVTLLRVVALENLRRNVVRCAIHLVHDRIWLAVVMRCAEVDHLDRSAIVDIDEDVLRFQVAMRHVPPMAVGDGLKDLLGNDGRFVLGEDSARSDLLKEFTTVTELCHQEDIALVLVDLVESHDVGMVQVGEDVNLVLQANALWLVQGQLVDHFDGALLTIRLHGGLLDLSKGALAQDVTVKLVLFHKDRHVLILDHEVLMLRHYVILGLDLLLLVNWSKNLLIVSLAATAGFRLHASHYE